MTLKAVLFDLGDTIMDEATEVKDEAGDTLRAELIPGMKELLLDLHRAGIPLGLVADTRVATHRNVLGQHGLDRLFGVLAISDVVGVCKPHPRIFLEALAGLGLGPADYARVAMVGNVLERDVLGANRLGLISIWFHWNDRRPTTSDDPQAAPAYTVCSVAGLRALLARLHGSAL